MRVQEFYRTMRGLDDNGMCHDVMSIFTYVYISYAHVCACGGVWSDVAERRAHKAQQRDAARLPRIRHQQV